MKTVQIADATLCREDRHFQFKEKLEIARQLEALQVDVIELPAVGDRKADPVLVRTIASFLRHAVLSVGVGAGAEDLPRALEVLADVSEARIRVELPVSPVNMEYVCHKKPDKMLTYIAETVTAAAAGGHRVEFCALDATRAEPEFLIAALDAAVQAGASFVTCCDDTGAVLPDAFAAKVKELCSHLSVPVGVRCNNENGLALAQALLAIQNGAAFIKTAVDGNLVCLSALASIAQKCGNDYGLQTGLMYTDQNRIIHQIRWILAHSADDSSRAPVSAELAPVSLDRESTPEAVAEAVAELGYDLSPEDMKNVYEELIRTAAKKHIGAKELDAIVASTALQVPATYRLASYMVTSGNTLASSAQITLKTASADLQGISIGAGPIDAAFMAIEKIIGHRYELDDFQIQSVTRGQEAMGAVIIKLRSDGVLYSGHGISTDIIEAGILAYINALNKIVYEGAENQ